MGLSAAITFPAVKLSSSLLLVTTLLALKDLKTCFSHLIKHNEWEIYIICKMAPGVKCRITPFFTGNLFLHFSRAMTPLRKYD